MKVSDIKNRCCNACSDLKSQGHEIYFSNVVVSLCVKCMKELSEKLKPIIEKENKS